MIRMKPGGEITIHTAKLSAKSNRTDGKNIIIDLGLNIFFLAALAAGLPACSGVALGFDRVVMIAAGVDRIDDVVAFPAERA